ncbi:MAG: VWA domain-containing protein [Armatimonadota bacterium]|jgi:Ca-activated chloride channel family protein
MHEYIRWANPGMLTLLWLVPLVVGLHVYAARARRAALLRLASPLAQSRIVAARIRRRRRLRATLMTVAIALLVVAAARPQFGTKMERVERSGVDVIFAVDTSRSMLARDVSPDRLSAAKETVGALLARMQGDRVGIVAFAGDAFLYCPLTTDYGAVQMFLDAMDTEVVGSPGTALAAAIEAALDGFEAAEHKYHHLVILTDGEDHRGGALRAAREVAGQGLTVHVIGVGGADGEPIPILGPDGGVVGHRRDESGAVVVTRLEEETLVEIAKAGGGVYVAVSGGGIPVDRLLGALQREEGRVVGTWQFEEYTERYQIPLAFAIVLIAACAIIPDERRRKT